MSGVAAYRITPETIGERILIAARRRGWNAVRLAKESGVSQRMIYRYMHDQSQPTADRIVAIARALGLDPNTLMGWDADMRPSRQVARVSSPVIPFAPQRESR